VRPVFAGDTIIFSVDLNIGRKVGAVGSSQNELYETELNFSTSVTCFVCWQRVHW
jgi:N-acetylglutamate synthase/N-acetylornithine aminotransferase